MKNKILVLVLIENKPSVDYAWECKENLKIQF